MINDKVEYKNFSTSNIKTEGRDCDHVTKKRMASLYVGPVQQSMFINVMNKVLQENLATSYAKPGSLEPEDEIETSNQINELILYHRAQLFYDDKASFRKISLRRSHNCKRTVGFLITHTLFGKFYLKSIIHQNCNRCVQEGGISAKDKYETQFTLYPAPWLLWLGVRTGLIGSFSTPGWKHTLEAFRAVPDSSLIFEFCRNENADGIKALFRRREASVWDRDSLGRTPLHVRAIPRFFTHHSCARSWLLWRGFYNP